MSADARIAAITARIVERSKPTRERYLARLRSAAAKGAHRSVLGCGNLAHGFAVCSPSEKDALAGDQVPNLGIITSYNDMLSAHQPFETYPAIIREAAARGGRHGAGRRRRAGHVRRRHAGPAGHGAVAVFARPDRHGRRRRPLAQHVRCGRLSRRLRQDRPGPGDRGALLRPSAGHFRAGRADDHGPAERRKVAGAPALRRRQGRPRRTARGGIEILSRPRHLHLLRHGELQPDADGDHGLPHARRLLHQSGHAAARSA